MKRKNVPIPPVVEEKSAKPDISRIPVEIDGKTYELSFEFPARLTRIIPI